MTISNAWDLSSDAELITAVRSGESAAFGVLYERHAGAARAVARQYSNRPADAEDAVSDAFSRVFSAIQGGGGPDVAFRAYLFTVLRRVAMERVESSRRAVATDDVETFEAAVGQAESTEEPALAGFERGVVSRAYKSLPERWQAVLWYTEVEELNPAEIAPILGLTANGVAALAYRAREGLRQAYLQQHLAAPEDEACVIINKKLGAYVRGGLAKRETALVESHLEECGTCRALVLELGDVNHGMRLVIAPLVLGAVAAAVLKGVGFGGAAGAVGAAAAAGTGAAGSGAAGSGTAGSGAAGSGAAGTAGTGATSGAAGSAATTVGAGSASTGVGASAAAAGTAVGASTTAAGVAASGVVAASVGVVSTAGAPSASAATAPTATGLAAVQAAVPAGATAVGAASGTAAAAGGLSALLAAVPVGALGVAAAGVVVAAAVGVAGVLGAFSSDATSTEPTAIAAPSEPAPTADDEPAGAGLERDRTRAGTDEGAANDGAADDGTADDGAASGDETAGEPTGTSGTGTGATNPTTGPGTQPVPQPQPQPQPEPEPEPEPVDPPAVRIPSLPAVTLTAGVPGALELEISNDGGAFTGTVRADFRFDEGTDWSVVAVPEAVDGGGAARTAAGATDWTCAPADAVTASCVRDGLEAHSTTSLNVHLSVVDPDVDGVRDLPVGIRAWTPGHGAEPAFTTVTAQVASAPARLVAGVVTAPVTLVAGRPGVVTVPVQNIGRTSVPATATVDLPADVTGTPVTGSPWTCAPAPGDASLLTCDLARLARGASAPLVLDAVADPAIRNRAAPGAVAATVRAAGLDAAVADPAAVTVRSAPAHYALAFERSGDPAPGPIDAVVRLTNSGGTDGYPIVRALLPRGFGLAPAGQGWDCTPNADGTTLCTNDGSALPAGDLVVRADGQATVPIRLLAAPGQVAGGRHHVTVNLHEGGAVGESVTFPVDVVHPADLTTSSVQLPTEVGHTSPLSVAVTNTGGVADEVAVLVELPTGLVPVDSSGWTARTAGAYERSVTVAPGTTARLAMTVRSAVPSAAVDRTVYVSLQGAAGATAQLERSVRLVPPPAVLAASTSLDVAQAQGDQTATVRFDVTNSGFGRAAGVALAATLPPGVVPADATGWSCSNGATRTCTRTVTVEPGATASWALQVRGAVDAARDVAITTRVSHGSFSVTGSHALQVRPEPTPTCAAAWQFGRSYAAGELASYGGRLFERQVTSISLIPPPLVDSRWTDLGPCA